MGARVEIRVRRLERQSARVAPPVGARVEISPVVEPGFFVLGRPSRGGASRNMYTLLPAVAVNSRPSRGGASRNSSSNETFSKISVAPPVGARVEMISFFNAHMGGWSPLPWGRE